MRNSTPECEEFLMKKFLMMLVAISRHYDQMLQSQRFVVAMALMLPGLMLISCSVTAHPFLFLSGALYLGVMLMLRLLGMRLKI